MEQRNETRRVFFVCDLFFSGKKSVKNSFFVCVNYFSVPTKGWLNLLLPFLVISGVLSLCLASVVFLTVVLFRVLMRSESQIP